MLCKNPHVFAVVAGAPVPQVEGRGRKPGKGKNVDMLKEMGIGGSIFEVPKLKMMSIKYSARYFGMKIVIRRLPNKTYFIKRIS